MKLLAKISIAFLLVFFIPEVKGQGFLHFPDSTVWKSYENIAYDPFDPCENIRYEFISNDTTIYNLSCKKVKKIILNEAESGCVIPDTSYSFLCEDTLTMKTYLYVPEYCGDITDPSYKCDTLLFDYNLQVGDTLNNSILFNGYNNNWNDQAKITGLDTIILFGENRRIWYFNSSNDSSTFFIEGLGSSGGVSGIINDPNFLFEHQLLCIKDSTGEQYTSPLGNSLYYQAHYDPDNSCDSLHPVNLSLPSYGRNKMSIEVWPNPVHDFVHVKAPGLVSGKLKVCVFNKMGQKVYEKQFRAGHRTFDISLRNYKSGPYVISITSPEGMINRKLIVN